MAERSIAIQGDSAEAVAYRLFLDTSRTIEGSLDKEGILNLYAECLYAVKNPNVRMRVE